MENWGHLIADMADKHELDVMLLLTVDAMSATSRRGHSMEISSYLPLSNGRTQRTLLCLHGNCCAYVQILPDPAPNQIDIGGTAVSMNCPVSDDHHWDVTKRTYTNRR